MHFDNKKIMMVMYFETYDSDVSFEGQLYVLHITAVQVWKVMV